MWPLKNLFKCAAIGLASAGVYNATHSNLDNLGAVRFARAGLTAFSMSYLYKRTIYNTTFEAGSEEYLRLKSEVHTAAAQKLLELCCANRGVFVKVGQHLGALDYLLPSEYVNVLKVLHSKAPTSSLDEIYTVIREELHEDPADLFVEFDETPLGAASLAQVHRAKLTDGREVAVKVQHPYVKDNAQVDMKTMELLVDAASWIFPEFQFQWLVTETKKNIPRELDFSQELKTTREASELFKELKWLKIPEVYEDLSTSRVLTMEFVKGGQINDLAYMKENQINRFEVSEKLGKLYSEMIFRKGFVHSDPHPGNILVKKKEDGSTDIVLLDHGLYQTLSVDVKTEYSNLWLSILSKDLKAMRKHSEALGAGPLYGLFACMITGRSWDAILGGIDVVHKSKEEEELIKDSFPQLLTQMTETLQSINQELLLILKTNDLLRGIEHTLQTQNRLSSYLTMSQSCVASIYEQKMAQTSQLLTKMNLYLIKQWLLFKIAVYYFYLSLGTEKLNFYQYLHR